MQYLDRLLNSLSIRENYLSSSSDPQDDSPTSPHDLNAKNLHTYLAKVLYNRRSKLNPLWNVILIAGLDEKSEPFLASVDLLGTTFSSPTLATGFGAHLAQPLLRRKIPDEEAAKTLSKEEAVELVKEAMKVLFYRDARSMDHYSIAVVEKGATEVMVKENEKLENQSWQFAEGIRGYGTQVV